MKSDNTESQNKRCIDCGLTKPLAEYSRNKSSHDGRQRYCKKCFSERQAASYRRRQAMRGKTVRERTDISDGHKRCPSCGETKPHDEFPRNKRTKDGYATYCKPCHNAKGRESKERLYGGTRHYHLKRRYGMGAAEIERMRTQQDNLCLVCLNTPAEHVDHDHRTGEVRGLLCFNCNGGLGQFKDDPRALRRAIEYLTGGLLCLRRKDDGAFEIAELGRPTDSAQDIGDDWDFAWLDARIRDDSGEPWETDVDLAGDEPYEPRFPVLDLSEPVLDEPRPEEPLGVPEGLCVLG